LQENVAVASAEDAQEHVETESSHDEPRTVGEDMPPSGPIAAKGDAGESDIDAGHGENEASHELLNGDEDAATSGAETGDDTGKQESFKQV
jgi:hypothetical protein